MFAELGEYSQNMVSEAFWTPNIDSSQFDEYPELGSKANDRPIKNQLCWPCFDEMPELYPRSKCSPN